jgi:hypothetical protein
VPLISSHQCLLLAALLLTVPTELTEFGNLLISKTVGSWNALIIQLTLSNIKLILHALSCLLSNLPEVWALNPGLPMQSLSNSQLLLSLRLRLPAVLLLLLLLRLLPSSNQA